jgi:hypothetical protein
MMKTWLGEFRWTSAQTVPQQLIKMHCTLVEPKSVDGRKVVLVLTLAEAERLAAALTENVYSVRQAACSQKT